jgi:hypothetical protein
MDLDPEVLDACFRERSGYQPDWLVMYGPSVNAATKAKTEAKSKEVQIQAARMAP